MDTIPDLEFLEYRLAGVFSGFNGLDGRNGLDGQIFHLENLECR
jgi:hypothetical protein